MSHSVEFSADAKTDIEGLYDFIAKRADPTTALGYVDRLESWCQVLSSFPNRGTCRNDIRPGLRVIGFERRVAVAFVVGNDTVVILRLLYGGRDLRGAFRTAGSKADEV